MTTNTSITITTTTHAIENFNLRQVDNLRRAVNAYDGEDSHTLLQRIEALQQVTTITTTNTSTTITTTHYHHFRRRPCCNWKH